MNLVKIGVIVNTHGLRGTLKVKSFTDFNEMRFQKGNQLFIDFKGEKLPITVTKFKIVKGIVHLDVEEYKHINEIEKFKSSDLYISEEMIHELDDDEFYFTELIGMDVYEKDTNIGTCIDVLELPQGELLVVKRKSLKNALIPFRKEFVENVDKDKGTIHIISMEGLLWG